jgi:hypothetical protein
VNVATLRRLDVLPAVADALLLVALVIAARSDAEDLRIRRRLG